MLDCRARSQVLPPGHGFGLYAVGSHQGSAYSGLCFVLLTAVFCKADKVIKSVLSHVSTDLRIEQPESVINHMLSFPLG